MPFSHYLLGRLKAAQAAPASPRRSGQAAPTFDNLEGRALMAHFGGGHAARHLAGSAIFGDAGASSATTATRTGGHHGGSIARDAQLTADLATLRTDLDSVLAGSSVTDAQRLALRTDLRTIATAGFRVDKAALAPVVDSLLTALADGSYDSDAATAQSIRDSFDALFTDSGVDSTLIDQTFTDIVAVARNLNVSTDELTTLAADRSAIQADLTRLGIDGTGRGFKALGSNLDLVLSGTGRVRGLC